MRQVHDHNSEALALGAVWNLQPNQSGACTSLTPRRSCSDRYRIGYAIETDPVRSTLPDCCNSSTANRACSSHMTWLLTSIRLGRAAYKHNIVPSPHAPMRPCRLVASSSPQLYLPVVRHMTIGGKDGKSTTPFAALHRAAYLYSTVPVMRRMTLVPCTSTHSPEAPPKTAALHYKR